MLPFFHYAFRYYAAMLMRCWRHDADSRHTLLLIRCYACRAAAAADAMLADVDAAPAIHVSARLLLLLLLML